MPAATTRSSCLRRARPLPRTARRPRSRTSHGARRSASARSTATSPTRQHLLEAVYLDEVEAICRSAADLADLEPWDALVTWLRQFVGFAATKRALAQEMLGTIGSDAAVFRTCRVAISSAGDELLGRAQAAGAVRADASFIDIARLLGGIASIDSDPEQIERILDIVIDGLRYQAPSA